METTVYLKREVHYLTREEADGLVAEAKHCDRAELRHDKRDGTYSVFYLSFKPVQHGQNPWRGKPTVI